ncbi:MAG: hypothetical protein AVDCRST_MAG29-244, partial [uncultured Nocardioidaceae bacterium]
CRFLRKSSACSSRWSKRSPRRIRSSRPRCVVRPCALAAGDGRPSPLPDSWPGWPSSWRVPYCRRQWLPSSASWPCWRRPISSSGSGVVPPAPSSPFPAPPARGRRPATAPPQAATPSWTAWKSAGASVATRPP